MKVRMLGTANCSKCKQIKPAVEEFCASHGIEFTYEDIQESNKESINLLRLKGMKQAPAFIIDREKKDSVVVSGDNIFIELNTL